MRYLMRVTYKKILQLDLYNLLNKFKMECIIKSLIFFPPKQFYQCNRIFFYRFQINLTNVQLCHKLSFFSCFKKLKSKLIEISKFYFFPVLFFLKSGSSETHIDLPIISHILICLSIFLNDDRPFMYLIKIIFFSSDC